MTVECKLKSVTVLRSPIAFAFKVVSTGEVRKLYIYLSDSISFCLQVLSFWHFVCLAFIIQINMLFLIFSFFFLQKLCVSLLAIADESVHQEFSDGIPRANYGLPNLVFFILFYFILFFFALDQFQKYLETYCREIVFILLLGICIWTLCGPSWPARKCYREPLVYTRSSVAHW